VDVAFVEKNLQTVRKVVYNLGAPTQEPQMTRFFIFALTIATSAAAQADSWTGRDKELHAIGGAAIGSLTTLATGKAVHGCAAAAGVGLAKELYDSQHKAKHTASGKDFAVTAIAGCLAAAGTGWAIAPGVNGGVDLSYKWKF
jgi:hypothetical protein